MKATAPRWRNSAPFPALASVPIKQPLAITGSVNQYGRVRPSRRRQ
ncbi:MAG: hypothetical protein M5R42_01530 [Rhodocyclaceae bacterium]|nr:hypothetical protein [Rhodocyclaceae bacterium]